MIMGFVLTLCSLLKQAAPFSGGKMGNENKASHDPNHINGQIISIICLKSALSCASIIFWLILLQAVKVYFSWFHLQLKYGVAICFLNVG